MITGVILYLPSVLMMLFLANNFLRNGDARESGFVAYFRLPRRGRFSLVRLDHRRSRQFLAGKQHPDPADLHDDAFPERRDHSHHLHAALAADT